VRDRQQVVCPCRRNAIAHDHRSRPPSNASPTGPGPPLGRGRLGDWIVNTDRGFSGRLNACWPLGDPGLPVLLEAVDAVEARYAAAGLPPLFKPVDGLSPALEAELARRGYAPRTETLMMVGPLRGEGGRAEVTADA
jgi:hypothetical protein